MKPDTPSFPAPDDKDARRAKPAVICYPVDTLPRPDVVAMTDRRAGATKTGTCVVAPRDAGCIAVPAGGFFRITCPDGAQVGDLNLWSAADLSEHFYSGKTRAQHGTHLSTGIPTTIPTIWASKARRTMPTSRRPACGASAI